LASLCEGARPRAGFRAQAESRLRGAKRPAPSAKPMAQALDAAEHGASLKKPPSEP